MKKNFSLITLICLFSLSLVGCNNNDTNKNEDSKVTATNKETTNVNDEKQMKELEQLRSKNEELENKNKELEEKLSLLEEKINDLSTKTDENKKNSDDNYANLEKKINNFSCNCDTDTNKNTITKDVLMTLWYENDGSIFDFNDFDKVEILGNFIIINDSMSVYYEYIDGKLYVSDDGLVLHK